MGAAGVVLGHGGVPGFESARERQARVQAEQVSMVLAKTNAIERSLARPRDTPPSGCERPARRSTPTRCGRIAAAVREVLKAEPSRVNKDRDERAGPGADAENLEAFEQAKGIIDTAITAGGRWGETHVRLLRPLLERMSPDESGANPPTIGGRHQRRRAGQRDAWASVLTTAPPCPSPSP